MDIEDLKPVLVSQFGAAMDMFENNLRACPGNLWTEPMWNDPDAAADFSHFWYVAYHTLFWLDLYLTGAYEGFSPPQPFTLTELDPAGVLPDKVYSPDELLTYLNHCRRKCQSVIGGLTDKRAVETCHLHWGNPTFLELLIDNLRHVQEHGAQLGMSLGQHGKNNRWISSVDKNEQVTSGRT